jgi:DnaJ-class molecular chaperone
MFIDYYEILDIDISSTQAEVKSAFKKQALKWHPDKNPGANTNDRMRLIIEAHLILKDPEARKRYDIEYLKHQAFKQSKKDEDNASKRTEENTFNTKKETAPSEEYTVTDDILNRWMENAAKQAAEYLTQTLEDFKGIASVGAKTFLNELTTRLIGGIAILIFLALIAKGCN